ncbi:MAG: hypothetical protein LBM76_00785 [Mycoplasmataceae bacterium]|nr:hypothetical protein [Mycoplasmataceae bacterium]
MPFISEKERQIRTKKLFKGSAAKKGLILFNTIITLFFILFAIVSVSVTFGTTAPGTNWKSFMGVLSLANPNHINAWILMGTGILAALLQIISLFVSASLKSAKTISSETISLASSAVAGKKKSGNSAKDFRERINLKDKKK